MTAGRFLNSETAYTLNEKGKRRDESLIFFGRGRKLEE